MAAVRPVAPAGATGADTTGDVVCTTNSTWTFTPGIVLVPRPTVTQVHDEYTSCVSLTDGTITGGASGFTVEREAGCLEPVAPCPRHG